MFRATQRRLKVCLHVCAWLRHQIHSVASRHLLKCYGCNMQCHTCRFWSKTFNGSYRTVARICKEGRHCGKGIWGLFRPPESSQAQMPKYVFWVLQIELAIRPIPRVNLFIIVDLQLLKFSSTKWNHSLLLPVFIKAAHRYLSQFWKVNLSENYQNWHRVYQCGQCMQVFWHLFQ